MFTLADTPVKFVSLLILFLFCTAWSIYELTRPQDRTQRVSNSLHLVMSLVMLVMVPTVTWRPFVHLVGGPVLIAVFVLSVAWFVGLAVVRREARGHYLGHAAMFGAMAWHLTGMVIKMPLMSATMQHGSSGTAGSGSMGGMPGMGATPGAGGMSGMGGMSGNAGMSPMAAASQPGGSVWFVALVGIPFMLYLLIAAIRDLVTAVRPAPAENDLTTGDRAGHLGGHDHSAAVGAGTAPSADSVPAATGAEHTTTRTVEQTQESVVCHEVRPAGSSTFRLAALAGFAMNFGMFWMSTGLMTPILPWMKLLSF